MENYRFVHLSDIHFGQEREGTLVLHEDVREELINSCRELRKKNGPAHGIIVTGDTAYAGKKAEYDKAYKWLDRLAEAVGCKNTSVFVIPGNHDVDLDKIDYNAKMLHEKIRDSSPAALQAHLEGLAQGKEENHPLFRSSQITGYLQPSTIATSSHAADLFGNVIYISERKTNSLFAS